MKIIVISDTHGEIEGACSVLKANPDAAMLIHLGDISRDVELISQRFESLDVVYVRGNSEFYQGRIPDELIIEPDGIRIFATHGHRYYVKTGIERLMKKAAEIKAGLVLFGHTHIPLLLETEACTFLNPGSMALNRGNTERTYAVVNLSPKKFKVQIMNYKNEL